MPETLFRVRWPDGGVEVCYSPSTIVKDYFIAGKTYSLDEFVELSRAALYAASERVRAQYGMHCARAMAQLEAIEAKAKTQSANPMPVIIEAFSN
jgi:uncharacterized repeat protein (TIGR04042 family)